MAADEFFGDINRIAQRVYQSGVRTGTGAEETIPHKLVGKPQIVLVVPTGASPATSLVEGAHDGTNVKVTVNTGGTYKVLAIWTR